MIKYFELLLDLLDVEESSREEYIATADKIESQKYSDLKCYHRHSFIFEGYYKLLNKEITTEEFIQIGDVKSKIFFDTKKQDSISFLTLIHSAETELRREIPQTGEDGCSSETKKINSSIARGIKSNPVLDDNILYIFDKISEGIIAEKKNIVCC